ncbi:hypothetical protein [Bradyrhizobium sp. NAS80.1]|uniref:hypothetical protein n=1 Tax=Bradyrhizobium sp. NAS80.1 TaxID=1680159 RepID=UPI001161458C|nr:hypothetical protein [Bradyrhizobium sp. NAS80.1]
MSGICANPSTGRARRRELAAEAEAERREIEAGLLRDLGRPATATDLIAIETISATAVRARRLRADGRNDEAERKLVAQLMRASGLKPEPAAPAAKPDKIAALREKYGGAAT